MAILKTTAAITWAQNEERTERKGLNLWTKYLEFAENQQENRTLWFWLSLMVHGVFFLPLPAALLYYYDAPTWVLAVTMVCFFTNIIANMGGAGIRATITLFFVSIVLQILMALAFVL